MSVSVLEKFLPENALPYLKIWFGRNDLKMELLKLANKSANLINIVPSVEISGAVLHSARDISTATDIKFKGNHYFEILSEESSVEEGYIKQISQAELLNGNGYILRTYNQIRNNDGGYSISDVMVYIPVPLSALKK
jgi:hypothetical protein